MELFGDHLARQIALQCHDESTGLKTARLRATLGGYGISLMFTILPFLQQGQRVRSVPVSSSISSTAVFFVHSGGGELTPSSSLQCFTFSFLYRLERKPKCLIFMKPSGRT